MTNKDRQVFRLSTAERASPLWGRLRVYLEDELAAQRRKNDAALNTVDTATVRGNIARIKNLLALGDLPPDQATEADEA